MNDRRSKYINGNIIKNKDLKVDITFDITMLDMMCSYIVSGNKNIRRGHIINMRNLFLMMDRDKYVGDQDRLDRLDFIMKGIDARLTYNLTDRNMILRHIYGGIGFPIDDAFTELNNSELDWINQSISSIIKDSIFYNDVDEGIALFTKFKATEFANRGPVIKEIEQYVANLNTKFRKVRAESVSETRFSLVGEEYESCMRETYRQVTSPGNKLKFGVQALNLLTGGGVESGRVYTLLGLPGEGKSLTLLEMMLELKKYNSDYVCMDPTKKPCIVLITMENGVKETVERIFSMCTDSSIKDYTEDEVVEILKSKGNLMVSDADPVNIFILYKPNLSVDTSYLYDVVEDLEDEGFETICVIQDYMKRIRSVEGSFGGDLRQQLGAIVNEFKTFAILKNIPVITASQLNRDATKHIDEARSRNKADLVRLLGRSNVGESNLIIENSDWIGLIAPEYDRENNKYLGMQRVKSRYYIPGDFSYAYIPYINNGIKFIEDFYSPIPMHKISMREQEMNTGISGNGMINEVKEFTDFNDVKLPVNDTPNVFLNANAMVAYNLAMHCNNVFMQNLRPMARMR